MKRKAGILFSAAFLTAVLVYIDRLVKSWAYVSLKGQSSIQIIPGVFQLTYAQNIGAAFSILENAKWFFILTAVIIMAALAFFIGRIISHEDFSFKNKEMTLVLILSCMIIAGALGNVIDRIMYGFVIDMFDFVLIHFAIFNVADSYIVVAVIVLGLMLLFRKDFFEQMERMISRKKPANDE